MEKWLKRPHSPINQKILQNLGLNEKWVSPLNYTIWEFMLLMQQSHV